MASVEERVTVDQALERAFWMAKLPSLAVFFGPILAYVVLSKLGYVPQYGYAGMRWALPTFLFSFVGSWLVWSVQIPRWRLWAYQRVDDIGLLKRAAVEAKIIWSDENVFGKTEIMSQSVRNELRRLEEASAARVGTSSDLVSLEGPVELIEGRLMVRIPLSVGGDKLAPFAKGIGDIQGDFLCVRIDSWLAEKLQIEAGNLVMVDNRDGKFTIARSPAHDQ